MPRKNVAQMVGDRITSHSIDLSRYTGALRRKILGHLRRMREEIIAKLANLPASSKAALEGARLTSLLKQTEAIIKRNFKQARDENLQDLRELAALESRFAASSLNTVLGVDLVQPLVTPSLLREVVSDSLIKGSPAREWWSRQAEDTRRRFADEIRQGALQGESIQDMIVRIRGEFTGKFVKVEIDGKLKSVPEFRGGVMDVTTRQAEALVRTSVHTITNNARMATYKDNDDVIKGVQAHVTLDNRTSEICMARSNAAWDLEGNPLNDETDEDFPGPPPWHWNCRTSLIPITYSYEELSEGQGASRAQRRIARLVDDETPRATRQSMDGQVAEGTSYEDWLRDQSETVQRDKLGATKFQLWKRGDITLKDMVDQEGRPLTVEQIGERAGLI